MNTHNTKQTRFRTDRLARLAHTERWHFWFIDRRSIVNRLLAKYIDSKSKRLLDIGCEKFCYRT